MSIPLYIVACSQTKAATLKHHPMPAREAYTGTAFKIARDLLESVHARWCILSGYYGFLWPDTRIAYYDAKIDPDPLRPWEAPFDSLKQKQYGRLISSTHIILLGSTLYARSAEVLLNRPIQAPLAGLSIGKALQLLKSQTWLSLPTSSKPPTPNR
jgi:hypothetical protein